MIHESLVQGDSILNKNNTYVQCKIGSGIAIMLNISTDHVLKFNVSVSNEIENTYNNSLTEAIGFVEKINTKKNYEIIIKNNASITCYQKKLYSGEF